MVTLVLITVSFSDLDWNRDWSAPTQRPFGGSVRIQKSRVANGGSARHGLHIQDDENFAANRRGDRRMVRRPEFANRKAIRSLAGSNPVRLGQVLSYLLRVWKHHDQYV